MSKRKRTPEAATGSAMVDRLLKVATAAGVDGQELINAWEENRIRMLLQHEVSFSIECAGGECQDCASGDALMAQLDKEQVEGDQQLDRARELGWTKIECAPGDVSTSHFFGLCPACKIAADADAVCQPPATAKGAS